MRVGQEISVEIEEGKTLFIRLVTLTVDQEAKRAGDFRVERHDAAVAGDRPSVQPKVKPRREGRPAVPAQSPRRSRAWSRRRRSVGTKVAKGDKLLTLEAMKMQTTIYAPCDGVVSEILVQVGEPVESKDLLMKLRGA